MVCSVCGLAVRAEHYEYCERITDSPPPDPRPQTIWLIMSGRRKGPYSPQVVTDLIGRKKAHYEHLCWTGNGDWIPLGKSAFAPLFSGPPPVPDYAISNDIPWMLALFPAVWLLCVAFTGVNIHWAVPILFNALLTVWDALTLARLGKRPLNPGLAGLAVPVYLFIRAERLHQPPYYAVVWVLAYSALLLFLPTFLLSHG